MSQLISTNVRKMTLEQSERRPIVTFRVVFAALAILSGMTIIPNADAAALRWHPTNEITKAAETFLASNIGPTAHSTTVRAGNLDSRHRLGFCSAPLEPFLRRGAQVKARTIVGVRCAGEKPWKVYVPVDVIVTKTVLVAKRTLPRGHHLTPDDLIAEERDVSRLLSGYVERIESLQGQRLKTQLIAGKILTPAMLRADIAIKRGQSVTLTASSGEFAIRTGGRALMDGALNQRIRVENVNTGRVIEGIVRSREHVEVLVAQQ